MFNTTYDVSKGCLIYINQKIDTGKVALDMFSNATYSDMIWGSRLTFVYKSTIIGNLTKISGNKYINWRFYFNSITEFEYYQNSFSLVHQ